MNDLLHGKRWVYWLDRMHPGPDKGTYRVSIVVESEAGHWPTGGNDKAPWYWDEETCNHANADRGFGPIEAFKIVGSSMAARGL